MTYINDDEDEFDESPAFVSELPWEIPDWFPELPNEVVGQLRIYKTELIRFNGSMNLISASTESKVDLVHFADSLMAIKMILKDTESREIFDVGSGNGFPGLVAACVDPSRQFILLDKDARKIEFLKHCASRMGLSNVQVSHNRIEELPDNTIECAISRGFSSLARSLLLGRKAFKTGGKYYHLKTEEWLKEVAKIPSQLCVHWEPDFLGYYQLPGRESNFAIVITTKVDN